MSCLRNWTQNNNKNKLSLQANEAILWKYIRHENVQLTVSHASLTSCLGFISCGIIINVVYFFTAHFIGCTL